MILTKKQERSIHLVNRYLIEVRKKSIDEASYAIMTMLLVDGEIPANLVISAEMHYADIS